MGDFGRTVRGARSAYVFWKRILVYVEAHEDVVFWEAMFRSHADTDVECRPYGKDYCEKYAAHIQTRDTPIIVAMDAEYSHVTNSLLRHDRIAYTYGHSIENTMYCPRGIAEVTRRYSRLPHPPLARIIHDPSADCSFRCISMGMSATRADPSVPWRVSSRIGL